MIKTLIYGANSFWRSRELIWRLARREISLRYSGSYLGVFWSFINPLAMLLVYGFVFGTVFKARWGAGVVGESYTVLLFVGMLIHGLFAECVGKSTTLIVANTNYVKKVVFPLEILPWTIVGAALFHFFIGLIALVFVQVVLGGVLQWEVVYLPLILIPYIFFLMGLSWFVAALGVFFRDLGQLVGMIVSVMMFLSPVFYSIESVPERYRTFMHLNPLTLVIEQSRQLIVYGGRLDLQVISSMMVLGVATFAAGLWFFNKTRKGFSDVL